MLPFLKNKTHQTALSIKYRTPDEKEPFSEDADSSSSAMDAAAQDLLKAIESRDYKQVKLALQAAFDIMDSEPHIEGPHLNKEE